MILARTPEDTEAAGLRHVWFTQSLGRDHHRRFGELAGSLPRQLYGMIETVAIVTADRSDPPLHDVIGEPIPGRVVRLVDPATHEDVEDGTPGMILVAGERGVDLFAEYLDDPATTDRSFTTTSTARSGPAISRCGPTRECCSSSDAPTTSSRSPGRTSASPRSRRSSPRPRGARGGRPRAP